MLEDHQSLSRLWENYKFFLEESISSFKRLKVRENTRFFSPRTLSSFSGIVQKSITKRTRKNSQRHI